MKKIDLDDDFDDDGYIKWGNFGKSWKQKDSAENGDGKDKSNDDDNDFADLDYKDADADTDDDDDDDDDDDYDDDWRLPSGTARPISSGDDGQNEDGDG